MAEAPEAIVRSTLEMLERHHEEHAGLIFFNTTIIGETTHYMATRPGFLRWDSSLAYALAGSGMWTTMEAAKDYAYQMFVIYQDVPPDRVASPVLSLPAALGDLRQALQRIQRRKGTTSTRTSTCPYYPTQPSRKGE